MDIKVVNLMDKFSLFDEQHKYKAVARINNYLFKLVKMHREFVWHSHEETDEVFMVFGGKLTIALRDKILQLGPGDMVSILKGVEHKPMSQEECLILLIEPEATVNTGNAGGTLTDNEVEWI